MTGKGRMRNTEQYVLRKVNQEHTVSALAYKLSDLNFWVVIVKSLKILCRGNKEIESLRTHLVEA